MHHHGSGSLFVVLSVAVAILGSWTALDLFRRVHSHIGTARRLWLATAAVAMGLSIWSMHFIAMLGFDPGGSLRYDPALTGLSLALAIGATLGAFLAASRETASMRRLVTAGVAMGFGICLMHYVGMSALRTTVSLGYDPAFVAASFVVAVVASSAALIAAGRRRSLRWRAAASVILGLAIVGMHYTAMAGLRLTPMEGGAASLPGAPPVVLGVSVAAGTLVILFLALLASLYDQRLNVLSALEAGDVGYWELIFPEMTLHASARAKEIFGRSPQDRLTRSDILAVLAPEEEARRAAFLHASITEGVPYDAEYRVQLPEAPPKWVNVRGRVVARRAGKPRRMAGVILDVTDRRQAFAALADAEERQRLLIQELNHRVKNTLATVQSIARQSSKGAQSVESFRQSFEARLMALSQAHNALTRGSWEAASLTELLAQEFSPYAPEQIRLQGPEVMLNARQTLAFGMMFHELATNAAKYGALSQATGRVDVDWRVHAAAAQLELEWEESGGPAVEAPERLGFGSRLIQSLVERELGGAFSADYSPGGFRCRIAVLMA